MECSFVRAGKRVLERSENYARSDVGTSVFDMVDGVSPGRSGLRNLRLVLAVSAHMGRFLSGMSIRVATTAWRSLLSFVAFLVALRSSPASRIFFELF